MTDEVDAEGASAPKKGGLMGLLVPVLLLTVVAAGGGGLIGMQIVKLAKAAAAAEVKVAEPPAGAAAVSTKAVKELTPIVTNLAAPDRSNLIRLQTAIIYDKADAPQIDILSAQIADDMLAFVRTLNLTQLQGASGLQHLREDLAERATIRSDGHIHDLMIETLVIQ